MIDGNDIHLEHDDSRHPPGPWCQSDPSTVPTTAITTRDEAGVTCPACKAHIDFYRKGPTTRAKFEAIDWFGEG